MYNFMLLTGDTAAEGTQATAGSWLITLFPLILMGVLMYFMMIRPQKKQQKQMQAMLSTIAVGDSVLTSSGFYGVVIDVMDDIVIVEFGNNKNCRIPMKKSAITDVEKPNTEKSQ